MGYLPFKTLCNARIILTITTWEVMAWLLSL